MVMVGDSSTHFVFDSLIRNVSVIVEKKTYLNFDFQFDLAS